LYDIPYRVYQLWSSLEDRDPGEWLLRRRLLASLSSKTPDKSDFADLGERRRRLLQDEWTLQASLPANALLAAAPPETAAQAGDAADAAAAAAATAAAAAAAAAVGPPPAAVVSTVSATETAEADANVGAAAACLALLSDEGLLDTEELVQARLLEVR
jgi:hypothetical protein